MMVYTKGLKGYYEGTATGLHDGVQEGTEGVHNEGTVTGLQDGVHEWTEGVHEGTVTGLHEGATRRD